MVGARLFASAPAWLSGRTPEQQQQAGGRDSDQGLRPPPGSHDRTRQRADEEQTGKRLGNGARHRS